MSFCKKCNNILYPDKDIIKKPEEWEKDGARCRQKFLDLVKMNVIPTAYITI